MKINKKLFYEQLKPYAKGNKKYVPISLQFDIENTEHIILIEENRNTGMKFEGKLL